MPASPGAASGIAVFDADRAELKRLMEEVAENKLRLSEETEAAEGLIKRL